MMVDALEENVMKDILSIGLQIKEQREKICIKSLLQTCSDSKFQLECLQISADGAFLSNSETPTPPKSSSSIVLSR